MIEINTLDELIAYCKDNNRVCPQPQLWNELWKKLKEKKQFNSGWQPPLPLILAACLVEYFTKFKAVKIN